MTLARLPLAGPLLAAAALLVALGSAPGARATVPAGFVETAIGGTWNEAVGMEFAPDGRLFVWERGGRVWIVEDGVKSASPFLDISDEVGAWRDFGLLGVALHPDFLNNGYVYLYYVVDRHHLLNVPGGSYDPGTDEYYAATQGRITRYTAIKGSPSDPDYSNATSVDYGSRFVLHGGAVGTGCPILYESHGTGHLVFGTDGTLLAACGDGASYSTTDAGSVGHTYYQQAIADGIMRPEEDVGAFRSQMLSSLSGKILRLDPLTGLGVPSNPWYDAGDPAATRSKVWALGLRNPYRMVLKPGTGSHDPADGDPGTLYVGDVGWNTWEDLQVADGPGLNFGWPIFEGLEANGSYVAASPENPDAPNPLYDGSSCTQEHFRFTDLLQQATLDPAARFPNPCNPALDVPAAIPTFFHARPKIDMHHGATGGARWGSFDGYDAIAVPVGGATDPNGKSVPGPLFGSNTSTAGVFYTGTQFPPQYQGRYLHAEWDHEWIKVFDMDANDEPVSIQDFVDNGGGIVFVAMDPSNGDLYYISWTATLWRVRYIGSGNAPPTAVASADTNHGPSPLGVSFTGDASSDPEGGPLVYDWDFGDGTPHSSQANPSHSFQNPGGLPLVRTVTLTVTDDGGANPDESDSTTLQLWLDDDAPVVAITSPVDGSLYSVTQSETYPLTATISDSVPGSPAPTCEWVVNLHHNEHFHSDPPITDCSSSTEIAPVACDANATYWWRVQLTVTDAYGLSTVENANLYPDEANCPNLPPLALADGVSVPAGLPTAIDVLANDFDEDGSLDPASVTVVTPPAGGSIVGVDPVTGAVSYQGTAASDSFQYTVADDDGDPSNAATVSITTYNGAPTVAFTSPLDGALFVPGDAVVLSAAADDPDDVASLQLHWQVDQVLNGSLVPSVFSHDGPSPPAWSVPVAGGAGDHVSYRLRVTVTDAAGETASDEAWLYPATPPPNLPPLPSFSATPDSGTPTLSVDFDASSTWDPEGDPVRYVWDFGDGANAEGETAQHDYTSFGVYHAVLTVTDALGASNSAALLVDTWAGGVAGEYYDDIALSEPPALTRIDGNIDFDWGSGSPDPAIPVDLYSVRWTGQIEPLYSEPYTLFISIDDGGRLWVDDVLVIDAWYDQAETEHASAPIPMTAGVPVDFRMEWYENGGQARARLRWQSASQVKQAIPADRLGGGGAPNAPPIAVTDTAGYARGGSVQIPVLANDADDHSTLDPASLMLGAPLHGSVGFDPTTGIVTYTHDGSATPADYFGYSVLDVEGLPSNTTSVLLNLSPSCGDGVVSGGEGCDDGNVQDGDCCSALCQLEAVGSSCSDGDACSDGDSCDGAGACVPGPPLACDDGLFCNGLEGCDPAVGCQAGAPPLLDDGVACTVDGCDEAGDAVTHAPDDSFCDDGLFCNGAELCDSLAGCQAGAPPALDDTLECTLDSCDELADQVVHAPDDSSCNDGLQCTADRCDELLGCVSERIAGCTPVPATGDWARVVLVLCYLAGGVGILAVRRRRER